MKEEEAAMAGDRACEIARRTRETDIRLRLDLDGSGQWELDTGVPFLDHMLSHVAVHGLFDLEVHCAGDTEIDDHHSVEDIGIVLGQAFKEAIGEKRGITRYGSQFMPMDEALVLVVADLSGRPYLAYDVELTRDKVGAFDTELVVEFLRALASNMGLTLHVKCFYGDNAHHIIEAVFKGLGRALGQAVARDPRRSGIPSTKGTL